MNNLIDQHQRPLRDLRISVIDRCNFRCPYCMPADQYAKNYKFLDKKEWLNFEEITRLALIFKQCGVNKIRLTGGEPLLRPNIDQLIKTLTPITELALTTNASLLYEQAELLKQAGLNRLTVSLDSLDQNAFNILSGGKGILNDAQTGIAEAKRVGFKQIKINCVVQKGINDHTIMDLIEYARANDHILRFIEYMDVGTCNNWEPAQVMPSKDIVDLINKSHPIQPADANYYGEVAKRYVYADGKGEVGFISSVSQPFCGSCTRARLSTDGKLYTCLFANTGVDLKTPLREGASDQELLNMIQSTWFRRENKYSEDRHIIRSQNPDSKKVEMFHIGG